MPSDRLIRAAVLAGAVTLPLAAAVPANASHAPRAATKASSSAFGLAASGPVAVPPTPAVSSAGRTVSRNVLELPPNPLLDARVLHASAGKGHARASVTDLRIRRIHLTASLISARCVKGRGTAHLARVELNGKKIKAQPTPNAGVNVAVAGVGDVTLTLNKQVRDSRGRLTVTAVELALPLDGGQTVSIASATCGTVKDGPHPGPGKPEGPGHPSGTPKPPSGPAPAPTPVPGDLPVTG